MFPGKSSFIIRISESQIHGLFTKATEGGEIFSPKRGHVERECDHFLEVELKDQFTAYVKRMQKVRLLSTPSLDDIKEADDYSRLLLENFRIIGEYALENRRMLEEILFPLLKLDRPLSDQEVDRLRELSTLLVDGEMSMEIDLHLSELIDDCLYQEEDLRLDAQSCVFV